MIIFSKLEKKGHLGNQLFQIASTIGIAKSNNHTFGFPKWSYESFFKNKLLEINIENIQIYQEETFHFTPKRLDNNNYDLDGWFQSEKYFDIDVTKYFFQFEQFFLNDLQLKFKSVFEKKTILISIRRGDFVDHPDYFQLPINYYINALVDNFPEWRERNLVILSDDVDYCKFHFSFLENVFFADDLTAIQQLGLASLCDDFIISNSTFSWWCAWLGEKPTSLVVRPLHYFTKAKNEKDNDKDYFPERWEIYNHLKVKIDLGETVFLFEKPNSLLLEYYTHYFRFDHEYNDLCNYINVNCNYKDKPLVVINDCIIPPFSIYFACIE
ncbi:MAG: alpha-1,2-fucosyltransferase, partial [Flavobacterium sp.]